MPVNIYDQSSLTWGDVQLNQITTSIFGILCFWGAQNVYSSIKGYYAKRKLIYLLNALQTCFLLIKTISATIYLSYFNLSCNPRGPLVNIPLVIAWDLIFAIILLKLLIFTPYPLFVQVFFGLSVVAHFALVVAGVALRTSSQTVTGICRDVYPVLYKYQYVIEAIVEIAAVLILLHGLAYKERGGIFATTEAIFKQLKQNENLRVFWVLLFITLKIIFSFSYFPFSTTAITHTIDSCRSALVCWAILREQSTVAKAVTRSREKSNRSAIESSRSQGNDILSSKLVDSNDLEVISENVDAMRSILISNESIFLDEETKESNDTIARS